MKYIPATAGIIMSLALFACAPTPITADLGTASEQTFFVQDQEQEQEQKTIPFEGYAPLGKPYQAFWSCGTATNASWNEPVGNVVFDLKEGKTINDLLTVVAENNFTNLSVIITDEKTFPHLRSALINIFFPGDYSLRYFDRKRTTIDFDEQTDIRWEVVLRIPESRIDKYKLEIPAGLKISYKNEIQAIVNFHNDRKIELNDNKPTTIKMYQSSLNRGTFGKPEEEKEEE